MSADDVQPRKPSELRITELSPTEWLIVDADPTIVPPDSYRGFIQLIDDRYEVTRFGNRIEYRMADTFERAVEYAGRLCFETVTAPDDPERIRRGQ